MSPTFFNTSKEKSNSTRESVINYTLASLNLAVDKVAWAVEADHPGVTREPVVPKMVREAEQKDRQNEFTPSVISNNTNNIANVAFVATNFAEQTKEQNMQSARHNVEAALHTGDQNNAA